MHRRTLLGAVATGATAALAGCSEVSGVKSPTPIADGLPSVAVEYSGYGALSPVARWTLAVERGRIGLTTTCRRDDATGLDVERSLADDVYGDIQRLVVDSAPRTWQADYPCLNVCASDDGTRALAVTIDGRTRETTFDPARSLPAGLGALVDRLDEVTRRFDDLNYCQSDDA